MKHNIWITSNSISKTASSQVYSPYNVGVRNRVRNNNIVQDDQENAPSILPERLSSTPNPASTKWITRTRIKVDQTSDDAQIVDPGIPSSDIVFFDKIVLDGVTDGENVEFGLPSSPDKGSEHIYLNGQLLDAEDYTIVGASVAFNFIPMKDSRLLISYREIK